MQREGVNFSSKQQWQDMTKQAQGFLKKKFYVVVVVGKKIFFKIKSFIFLPIFLCSLTAFVKCDHFLMRHFVEIAKLSLTIFRKKHLSQRHNLTALHMLRRRRFWLFRSQQASSQPTSQSESHCILSFTVGKILLLKVDSKRVVNVANIWGVGAFSIQQAACYSFI